MTVVIARNDVRPENNLKWKSHVRAGCSRGLVVTTFSLRQVFRNRSRSRDIRSLCFGLLHFRWHLFLGNLLFRYLNSNATQILWSRYLHLRRIIDPYEALLGLKLVFELCFDNSHSIRTHRITLEHFGIVFLFFIEFFFVYSESYPYTEI